MNDTFSKVIYETNNEKDTKIIKTHLKNVYLEIV